MPLSQRYHQRAMRIHERIWRDDLGHYEMISPYWRRGKGIGFADRPVVSAVPRPREPMDRLATSAAVRFKTAQWCSRAAHERNEAPDHPMADCIMVLWCDPLAIALTAAASARRSTTVQGHIGP
jgi:hypothetical protein